MFVIAACAGVADVVFVLDNSGSLLVTDWTMVLDFCVAVVHNLYVGRDAVRVAAVVYGNTARVAFNLLQYETKTDIISALENIPYSESFLTRTDLALDLTRTDVLLSAAGARDDVSDVCIVVTDGQSQFPNATVEAADRLHDAGVRTFTIAIGRNSAAFQEELRHIASAPASEHLFEVSQFSSLRFIEETLVLRTCRPSPAGTSPNSGP